MASNKYMTVDQLAERWMCSPSYVRTLLRSGQLSAVKIAGWKVRQDEVLRFEKAKEQADTGNSVSVTLCNYCNAQQRRKPVCERTEISINLHAS